MEEWETLFEGEVEGRPVKLEMYTDEDGNRSVKVTTVGPEDEGGGFEELGEDAGDLAGPYPAGSPIVVEPSELADLEEELLELGFSDEAAGEISRHVPERSV
jgi:hypothetical protein